jgi:hypothetical protein
MVIECIPLQSGDVENAVFGQGRTEVKVRGYTAVTTKSRRGGLGRWREINSGGAAGKTVDRTRVVATKQASVAAFLR